MRMGLALAAVTIVALATPVGARPLLDAGVVAVDADVAPTPDCVVSVDGGLCVVSWQRNGTLLPNDDTIRLDRDVRDIGVTMRPGVGPTIPVVSLGPGGIVLANPAFPFLNRTWLEAGADVPAPLRQYLTLDSRPPHDQPSNWGVFVTVHPPFPITTPLTTPMYDVGEPVACWDLWCGRIQDNHDLSFNETAVVLFPESFLLANWSTDEQLAGDVSSSQSCVDPYFMSPDLCDFLVKNTSFLDEAAALYTSVTPNVRLGFALERFDVADERHDTARGSSRHGTAGHATTGGIMGENPRAFDADAVPSHMAAEAAGLPHPDVRSGPFPQDATPLNSATVTETRSPRSLLLVGLVGAALGVAFLAFYTRISRERVLLQPTRRTIYELIGAQPGLRISTLADRLGLSYKTVQHHVDYLRLHGLVTSMGVGQQRYFVAGACPRSIQVALAVSNPTCARMLSALKGRERVELGQLCAELGLAKSTGSWAAGILTLAGLVTRSRERRRVVLTPCEPA